MANHFSHAWPLAVFGAPIRNTRFTMLIPYLDADGDPTDPTTPDTEVSEDGGAFVDAAEEATTITGSNGIAYLTLTGAETDNTMLAVAAKVASGPKATLATLYPAQFPTLESGTAQAGAASTITLAAGAAAYDLTGCIVRTTGGTGGGGVGGVNNQARLVTAYNTGTKAATIYPDWEINPDATTTYDVLITPLAANSIKSRITSASAGVIDSGALATDAVGEIADGVWDEASADHVAAGSVGERVERLDLIASGGAGGLTNARAVNLDNLDAAVTTRATPAQVNTEVDNALVDLHLDHLIAVADPGAVVANNSFLAKLVSKSATATFSDFVNTTDSLQAIRDNHPSNFGIMTINPTGAITVGAMEAGVITEVAFATGAISARAVDDGLEFVSTDIPYVLLETTIATLTSQTNFTLATGAAENDAYNHCVVVLTDQTTSTQKAVSICDDWVGGTKQMLLRETPTFAIAVGDTVTVVASRAATPAQVNAEVLDVVAIDQISELAQAIPAATPTIQQALMLLYMAVRNKIDVTASVKEIHNDAGTVIAKKILSDDGTTYSEAEMVAGP